MPSKATLITLSIIVLVLLVVGFVTYKIRTQHQADNSDAAELLSGTTTAYTTFTGEPTDLNEYSSSVRVVTSWASWSPLSIDELQKLNKLAQAYQEQNVEVLAINRNENVQHAQRFIDRFGPFPHITFIADSDDGFFDRVDGVTVPETLFFDHDGNLVTHKQGPMRYNDIEAAIQAMLTNEEL